MAAITKKVAGCPLCANTKQRQLALSQIFPEIPSKIRYQESTHFRCCPDMCFSTNQSSLKKEAHFIIYPKTHYHCFADLPHNKNFDHELCNLVRSVRKEVSKEMVVVSEIIFEKSTERNLAAHQHFDHAHLHLIFSSERYDGFSLMATTYAKPKKAEDWVFLYDKPLQIFSILRENLKYRSQNTRYAFIKFGYLQLVVFGEIDLSFKAIWNETAKLKTILLTEIK